MLINFNLRRSKTIVLILSIIFIFTGVVSAAEVEFTFNPAETSFEGEINKVYLAGTFNEWQPSAEAMNGPNDQGVFSLKYNLRPGEHQYKFVINGEDWFPDPNNDLTTADGHGGNNSVINVGQRELKEAKIGDGLINEEFILHKAKKRKFLNKLTKDSVKISFETRKDDVEQVYLMTREESTRKKKKMKLTNSDNKLDYWTIKLDDLKGKLEYSFLLEDADLKIVNHKNGNGFDNIEYYSFKINELESFITPAWVKDAVFYQIFPDRFYNGNPDNDPDLIESYKNKKERYENIVPGWEQGIAKSESHQIKVENLVDQNSAIHPKAGWHVFYGGDLQGVEKKFDYLKGLGVNAIYFNPIFEATANHRYNAADYAKIDDNLAVKGDFEASEEYFFNFIKKAHQNDIKIVLDAVFNHSGFEFFAFQDVVEKGINSEYKDWFYIEDYPILTLYEQRINDLEANYKGWAGYGNHPVLNLDNPEVKDYIYKITEKWMDPNGDGNPEDGIDGWRLDVANDVKARHPEFWQEWRSFVKKINPEAYITGEIWNNAAQYLQGDEFDAVMNYRFRDAALAFIAEERIDAAAFISRINKPNLDYPEQAVFSMQNLIDSHDTERFLYSAAENKKKLKLAAALQFSYPGAPMIYYGTEVGLSGAADPDNRRTMIWEERANGSQPDMELYNYYSKLAQIRKDNKVLRTAGVEFKEVSDNTVIVKRKDENGEIYTLLNVQDKAADVELQLESVTSIRELLSDSVYKINKGKVEIDLAPYSTKIIKIK